MAYYNPNPIDVERASFFMNKQGVTRHSQIEGRYETVSMTLLRFFYRHLTPMNQRHNFDLDSDDTKELLSTMNESLRGILISIIINPEIKEHPYNKAMQKLVDQGRDPDTFNLRTEKIQFDYYRDEFSEFKRKLKNRSMKSLNDMDSDVYEIFNMQENLGRMINNADVYTDDYSAVRAGYREYETLGEEIFFNDSTLRFRLPGIASKDSLDNFVMRIKTPQVLQAKIKQIDIEAPWVLIPRITVDIMDKNGDFVAEKQFHFCDYLLQRYDSTNANTFDTFSHNAAYPYSNITAYQPLHSKRLGSTGMRVGHRPAKLIENFAPKSANLATSLVDSTENPIMQRVFGNKHLSNHVKNYLKTFNVDSSTSGGKKTRRHKRKQNKSKKSKKSSKNNKTKSKK